MIQHDLFWGRPRWVEPRVEAQKWFSPSRPGTLRWRVTLISMMTHRDCWYFFINWRFFSRYILLFLPHILVGFHHKFSRVGYKYLRVIECHFQYSYVRMGHSCWVPSSPVGIGKRASMWEHLLQRLYVCVLWVNPGNNDLSFPRGSIVVRRLSLYPESTSGNTE